MTWSMNQFSVEKPMPYYEQFYHKIKQMIFQGEIKPGERINETQLAKDFNVSKSPIREAIRLLEKEGLVVVNEKSKVMVYEPTLKDVEEIYFCRKALESSAVALLVEIATDEEIAVIEKSLLETEQMILRNDSPDQIISSNERFHNLIILGTKNGRLQNQIDDLRGLVRFFRILNFRGEGRAETILSQHREIYQYIKNRDADNAAKQMMKHLALDTKHLLEVLGSKAN